MILKVQMDERQELMWWILDGIRTISVEYLPDTRQKHVSVNYNFLSDEDTEAKTIALVRCTLAQPTPASGTSCDVTVAFDGVAYIENDNGRTIESIRGSY